MTLAATFALADPAFTGSLAQRLGRANRVQGQDELLSSADGFSYAAECGNWQSTPPYEIRVDGTLQAPDAYTTNLVTGTVSFAATAQPGAQALVTASYWAAVYNAADLLTLLEDALGYVEGQLGITLDDAAVDRQLKEPITMRAQVAALEGILGGRLDAVRWAIDGKTVDRKAVAASFNQTITATNARLQEALAWLRPQYAAGSGSVVLDIDRGVPPNSYSHYGQR